MHQLSSCRVTNAGKRYCGVCHAVPVILIVIIFHRSSVNSSLAWGGSRLPAISWPFHLIREIKSVLLLQAKSVLGPEPWPPGSMINQCWVWPRQPESVRVLGWGKIDCTALKMAPLKCSRKSKLHRGLKIRDYICIAIWHRLDIVACM